MSKFVKTKKDCDHSGYWEEKLCLDRTHVDGCYVYVCKDCGSRGYCEIGESDE